MKTITFYSYKGGVGRSLALANIASRLAEFGRQVCLLDFDLEAPGLHYKFATNLNNRGIEVSKGIVDYIYQFSNTGSLPERISDFSYSFLSSPKAYTTLIPAGDVNSSEYWKKLSSINWYDLLYDNPSGLSFLLDLKEKIRKEFSPDFLLIDSRTGISEMSGITLSLLGDEVVIVAANNRENLEGSKKIIKSISNPNNIIVGKVPKITFVLSRIPFTDKPEDKTKEQNLISKIKREFGGLIEDIDIIHSDRDLEENEQIKIGYEKDESVAQISRDYLKLFEKLTIDELSPEEITSFKNIKDSERQYQKAISENSIQKKLTFIDKAIELNSSNIEFILYRAVTHEQLQEGRKAIEDCNSAIYLDTSNLLAYEIKARNEFKLGDFASAKNTFERILGFNKNRVSAILGLADVFTQNQEYDRALSLYNEVINLDAENPIAYTGRANIKVVMNNPLSALEDVYHALEVNSEYGPAFETLAEINAHIDNKNEFYLNLEKALKLDLKMVDASIKEKRIFKTFYNDKRFMKLIEKYNIHLENGE